MFNLIRILLLTSTLLESFGMALELPGQGFEQSIENAEQTNQGPIIPEKGPWTLLKENIEDLKKQGLNTDILQAFDLIRTGDLALAKDKVDDLAQQGDSTMQFLQSIPSLFEPRNVPSPEDMIPQDNILSLLLDLPEEMTSEILKWLDPQDKAALLCVNKDRNKFIGNHFIKPPVSYGSQEITLSNPKSFDFTPQWNVHYTLNIRNTDIQILLDPNPCKTIMYKLLFLKKNIRKIHIGSMMQVQSLDVVKLLNQYIMISAVKLDYSDVMWDCVIDMSGLVDFLKINKTLRSLDLSHIQISDPEAKALGGALKVNKTLTHLTLFNNQISSAGAQALGEALLKVNKALTYLDMSKNQIRDDGAQALGEALKGNKTLRSLYLLGSGIGDAEAQALVEGLQNNKTLTFLNLLANSIGDAGAQAIGDALKINKTLTFLDLHGNQIGDNMKQSLKAFEDTKHPLKIDV